MLTGLESLTATPLQVSAGVNLLTSARPWALTVLREWGGHGQGDCGHTAVISMCLTLTLCGRRVHLPGATARCRDFAPRPEGWVRSGTQVRPATHGSSYTSANNQITPVRATFSPAFT